MNLKLVIGVLASSIVPLITYIVSTIVAHVHLKNYIKEARDDFDEGYTPKEVFKELLFYFTSSYVTFGLFIFFLAIVILAGFNILKNNLLIIILTFFDGAVMVTAGASLHMSLLVSYWIGAGAGMFFGAALFLLVKIFPILPLTYQLLTKGIPINTGNEYSMFRKYLPLVVICGAFFFGFLIIASLVYTGAALAVIIKFYTTSSHLYTYPEHHYYDPHEICHACPLFQYSLPLIICVQMIVAMVLFVLFKWKWAVRAFTVLSSFLLIILGYGLNMMAFQLYTCDDDFDFLKVLHKGNIIMTATSVFMVVITIFVNMAWPVLYNLRNSTGNGETRPLLN